MEDTCSVCGGPLVGEACVECAGLYVWPAEGADDPLLGRVLDERYRIDELLKVGGMARLYRGVQQSLDRPVAIKVLPPRLLAADDEEMLTELVTRFFTEAKAMSRLKHPNVANVYDFGRMPDTGWLYMVMELLTGDDLWHVLHAETLGLVEIGNIVTQTLEALAEAHSAGITHRDIKPENVIVERRRDRLHHVKLIDFGVAKLGAGGAVTRNGRIVGSPHYMSPEQARGDPVGPSADLYSVGVLLFELVTGQVPFDGPNAMDVLRKLQAEPTPDPRSMTDRPIPDAVVELCRRALAKNPSERFADAAEFAVAVADALAPPVPPARGSLVPGGVTATPLPVGAAFGTVRAPSGGTTLYCRAAHLRRAAALLDPAPESTFACFSGEEGTGRTRLAEEIAIAVRAAGHEAIVVRLPSFPRSEVGYSSLEALVAALLGSTARLDVRRGDQEPHPATLAALESALAKRAARVDGRLLVVMHDDTHRADANSRAVLGKLVTRSRSPDVRWVLLGRNPVVDLQLDGEPSMPLSKLPPEVASEMAAELGGPTLAGRMSTTVEIDPLTVDLASRIPASLCPSPPSLVSLLTKAFGALSAAEKRVLAGVAVLGEASSPHLARVLMDDECDPLLPKLLDWGLLEAQGSNVAMPHEAIARASLLQLPAWSRAELYDAAAGLHRELGSAVEIVAALAVRGDLDLAGCVDLEGAVKLRRERGDLGGAVDLLQLALKGARGLGRRGETEAASSARGIFGRQLVRALSEMGAHTEADRVVDELLSYAEEDGVRRDELAGELVSLRGALA